MGHLQRDIRYWRISHYCSRSLHETWRYLTRGMYFRHTQDSVSHRITKNRMNIMSSSSSWESQKTKSKFGLAQINYLGEKKRYTSLFKKATNSDTSQGGKKSRKRTSQKANKAQMQNEYKIMADLYPSWWRRPKFSVGYKGKKFNPSLLKEGKVKDSNGKTNWEKISTFE